MTAATPITDLQMIERLAEERRDEFQVMRYMLEINEAVSDAELDRIVEAVAAPVVAAIDCTQCGNCCRSLDVYLTPADVDRISAGIDVPLDEVITRYVDRQRARPVEEWGLFKARPCAFLRERKCSIYAHRPETCRTYPQFTPDFRWVLDDLLDGAGICPIIYNVLDRMNSLTEALSRHGPAAAEIIEDETP